MPNIKTLQNTPTKNKKHCHCQQKGNCPMNSACLKESLVYHTTISCNDKNYKPKLHNESCKTNFEKGYNSHKKSFNETFYKHDTKLSTKY